MTQNHNTECPAFIGRAYPALQSNRVEATLLSSVPLPSETADQDDLALSIIDEHGTVIATALLSHVTVDPPLGSTSRRITFPDGTLFETDEHQAVETLTGETHGSILHSLEQFRPRLMVLVVACIAAVWVLWRFGLDILVAAAIALTPPVVVAQIDRGTLSTIDFTMSEETLLEDAQQAKIQKIFKRLLSYLDEDDIGTSDFKLLFRSMPDVGPNAFALPNGTVVITDEFIEQFDDEDILASVLGHEIGHVIEKHGLRQTYRSLSIYVLVAFLAGETGPFIEDLLLEGNLIMSLAYSREHETSADHFGLHLAHDAGYDPNGLKKFFEWVTENAVEPPQWLSTHPSSTERVQEIDDFIKTLN
ncbi:M48 family metallopeptidase [Amylibacter sp. SFDW26]|uniref:M48 family metallopeptidase n=1 Tax=Amylibacter sp. SFDW26 TaxID=2652722 RepID=UPI0012629EE0|nr:M48 family metallopeptidase [Amylibacter sp. SFDW26]KAB7613918.1 M48 family metallopeptidase [Amylibacter sp. SFDW26]